MFNGAPYIRECLDSVLAQTWRPIEIIVVDDGSTDRTPELVAEYAEAVAYIRQGNAGAAAARNRGVRAAAGAFVAVLDSDDLWHSEKLARQMARFEQRPELEMCVTYLQNFWNDDVKHEEASFRGHPLSRPQPAYLTVAFLGRRHLFDTIGEFDVDLRLGEDTDWFLRAAEQGVITELLRDVMVYRRVHGKNTTRDRDARKAYMLKVVKASVDRRNAHQPRQSVSAAPDSSTITD